MNNIETRCPECTAGFTEVEALGLISSPGAVLSPIESLDDLRVGVIFEDLVDPLCVEGHIDEDARLVGPSTASAMDTHSHNNPDVTILTHKRATIIPLTYSLIPLASCTDLGVGDVEVPSVHLSTLLITDNGQVDRLQYVIMASAFGLSPSIHFTCCSFWDGASIYR